MPATTPHNAYTDGLTTILTVLGWAAAVITIVTLAAVVILIFLKTYEAAHTRVRRTLTARRLRRQHHRSGRA